MIGHLGARTALPALFLYVALPACNVTTQWIVTTTYQGVNLDILLLEQPPQTSHGDVQDGLVVHGVDERIVLRPSQVDACP